MTNKLQTAAVAFLIFISTVAMACPKGTHPVCTYDPSQGRSVCHCVSEVNGTCEFKDAVQKAE
jgi:hypothetical protein